jgi:hypothetical protein
MKDTRQSKQHIIVLVHGTWARGAFHRRVGSAEWCRPEGKLRTLIESQLPERDVSFELFNWSGSNSYGGRRSAGWELRQLLIQLQAAYPTALIHVIAHSHGGNVLLYAMEQSEAPKIASAVFLSTPFLHVAPRELGATLGPKMETLASLAVCVLIATSLYALPWLGVHDLLSEGSAEGLQAADRIRDFGLYLLTLLPFLLGVPFIKRAFRRISVSARKVAVELRLPERVTFPTLIVRTAADEASTALATAQFLSTLVTRILRLILRVSPHEGDLERAPSAASRRAAVLFSVSVFLVIIGLFGSSSIRSESILGWPVMLMLLLGAAVVSVTLAASFTTLVLAAITYALLALCTVPYGWRFALSSIGLQISAEATPPGFWRMAQIGLDARSLEDQKELNHATHSNTSAIHLVCHWLRAVENQFHDDGAVGLWWTKQSSGSLVRVEVSFDLGQH